MCIIYLKGSNLLYKDIDIEMNNILAEFVDITEQTKYEIADIKQINSTSLEDDENPFYKFKI